MTPPGTRVSVVVGKHKGKLGTAWKRNGKSTCVGLHDADEVLLRDWSGNLYAVHPQWLRRAQTITPASASVVPLK